MNEFREAVNYPGGSRTRVNKAGDAIRNGVAIQQHLQIIDEWRAAHRPVLNTFQAILRTRTRNTGIAVAQRHKRKKTIFDKLQRFPNMSLSRMDDIAGCRLIFNDLETLYSFRATLHKARFKHKLRNEIDKYDYIKHPKSTGYRGVHDIYEYDVNSAAGKSIKGLFAEIQYRTLVQHAWATAVEVIPYIAESQPKFQQGDTRYAEAMTFAAEILARAFENNTGCYPDLTDREVVSRFIALNEELSLINALRSLNAADATITEFKNAILIFSSSSDLEVKPFRDATDAVKALFELEKEFPEHDIVLVRADTSDEVRLAFRNYFSDAREFIRLLEDGCAKLT